MRVILQRVISASVKVEDVLISAVNTGMLIFAGIENADTAEDIEWLSNKICNLRIFDDEQKIPNLSIKETNGDILLVSQFTLHASTKKGNRPSYIKAAKPDIAVLLYQSFIRRLEADLGKKIQKGKFGADMKVALVNDGPLTIIIDTKNKD